MPKKSLDENGRVAFEHNGRRSPQRKSSSQRKERKLRKLVLQHLQLQSEYLEYLEYSLQQRRFECIDLDHIPHIFRDHQHLDLSHS